MDTIWKFRTRNFTVSLACEPDTDADLSFDETGETRAKIASGEWDCVVFRVLVEGPDGEELATDYLSGSIYADVKDFRKEHVGAQGKHGSYFRDMVSEAVRGAREEMRKLQSVRIRETA